MKGKRTATQRKKTREAEYDFSLILTGIAEVASREEDALFEAGCDDSTISVRFGRVFVTFSRSAPSLKEAILSAIRDIRKANIGANVLRVDACNLVTQAEIARKIGRTRQLVHQYTTGVRGPGGFPAPACDLAEGAPLWAWCEVAHWLFQNDMIREDEHREAREIAVINSVLDLEHQRHLDPDLASEVLRAVAEPPSA